MLLAERTTEIAVLEELLAACRTRVGQLAVISGPVGCGKTELLDAFVERALRSGTTVLGAVAKRSGADVAFDVLVQLFCGSTAPERLRRQMDKLVDATSAVGPEGAAVRTHALRVLFTELVTLADAYPIVIVVDDVECADHESLRELMDLVSRLRRAQALVVLSLSQEKNAATALVHAELLRHRRCRRIELSLLSVEGVDALISAQPGGFWPDVSATEIHRLSGGNPLLVRALLDDLRAGDPRQPGTAFGQALLACLHRSSPDTLAVARGIAVLDRPACEFLLAGLVGIDEQRVQAALRRLESAGLLSAGEFRSPASRTVVLADTGVEERRKLHERATELLYLQGASASTVARHLLEVGDTPQRWTQRLLREAAELAAAIDDLDFASDCLDLALKSSPDDHERATALVGLVGVAWRRNPGAVVWHLPALIESSRRGLLTGRQAFAVARSLVWHGLTGEAVEVIEAVGRSGRLSDGQTRAEVGIIRRWLRVWHPPLAEKVYGVPQPEALEAGVVADERFVATALLSEVLTRGGDSNVPRRAEELLRGIDLDETTLEPAESALYALLYSDHAERALAWCEPLLAAASERYAPTWTARLEAVRAEIALHQGDLSQAARYARAALDRIAFRGWGVAVGAPLATLIQATTMMGDQVAAGAYVKTPVPQEMFKTRFGLRYLHARGLHLAASDRLHAALSDLLTCGSLASEWGMDVPSFIPWRTAAAEVYVKLGDRERGRKMAESQLMRVNKGQARARGISLRVVATSGELRRRLHLLRESVDLLHSAGDRFELATALAELHQAHQEMGERQRANAVFQQALRLATECRAEPLRRSLLRESSDEDAESLVMKEPNGGLVRLSRAERRVTTLAATGHTNREIAQKLYITVSTVEQHLTKAYRKLNVSNRADLAAACLSSLADSA